MSSAGVMMCLLLLGVLVYVGVESATVTYSSHRETYQVQVLRASSYCRHEACGYTCYWRYWWYRWYWWNYWWNSWCYYTTTCYRCSTVYTYQYETRSRCQSRWTGGNCDIPICLPACGAGEVCEATGSNHQCRCITRQGGTCESVPCVSSGKSCYPGTCEGGVCKCPPDFTGDNCERLKQIPKVSECRVQLFSGNPETEVASANCAVEGVDKPEVNWVGKNQFSRILLNWEATYADRYNPVLPTATTHIADAKFGVTYSRALATLNMSNTAEEEPNPRQVSCTTDRQNQDPRENIKCPGQEIKWAEFGRSTLPDNSTIKLAIVAKLGGFKRLKDTTLETITGVNDATRLVLFKVDASPPWHCRKAGCTDPTISLENDAVKSSVIEGNFTDWYDYESGIDRYCVEVYELLKAGSNTLEPSQRQTDTFCKTINQFQYTIPSPGVFSLVIKVYDKANNTATARKIVLYDNQNRMAKTDEPLRVDQVSVSSNNGWMTTRPQGSSNDGKSRLTLSWKGRYANKKHLDNGWLYRVAQNQDIIDDNLLETFNRRTIHEVQHANGTVAYKVAFRVDQQGGRGLHLRDIAESNVSNSQELDPSTWAFFDHKTFETTLVMPSLTANDTIGIWIQASDVAGYSFNDHVQIRFDNTPPNIDKAELLENAVDQYTSSVQIRAEDPECGVKEVRYWISTRLTPNITSGTAAVTKLKPDGNRRRRDLAVCRKSSQDCYCVRGGDCFARNVRIVLDHCQIDQYYRSDQKMTLDYVVVNQAEQTARAPEPFVISFPSGPPQCRSHPLSPAVLIAIAIGALVLIALIVLVVFAVLRYMQGKHPVPDRVRTFATSVRQRVTNTEKVLSSDGHVIYRSKTRRGKVDEEDDDIYVDGRDPGGWRVNRDQVELTETLADGRFATVKKAYLKKGGKTETVAAKYLPAGASDSDKALMRAKIAFHGNRVPPHENIVRLVGVVDEGQIMLLEFCDLTLKQWLSNVGKVDTDVLENMLNFTMHIASGMEFLHSKNILHRRLAMRNVLLKKDGLNGLVAKLIGFGSFNDSGTEDQAEEATANVAVPLKWLAPETLESVGKGKAVYTQKSDVWAYAVTIWEIYSLGSTPYPGKKSAEVESVLKTGYRMPRPDECPPELFDSVVTPCWNVVAKKRPDFKTLCKSIRSFRSGGDQQEGYYAAGPARKTYDNPKERTNDYVSGHPGKSAATGSSLYDDTRK